MENTIIDFCNDEKWRDVFYANPSEKRLRELVSNKS